MRLTNKTKTEDFVPLLNDERMSVVMDAVTAIPLRTPIVSMSIAAFAELSEGILPDEVATEPLAVVYLGKLKTLTKEVEGLSKYIAKMQVPQSADERTACAGVDFPSLTERMLLDCAEFFSLHSFDDAEKMTVASWLLIQKNKSANARYQYNFSKIKRNGKR